MRLQIVRLLLIVATVAGLAPSRAAAQDARSLADLLRAADSAWSAPDHDGALAAYERVLRQDSTVARAVYRVATLLSWRNELDRATALLLRGPARRGGGDGRRLSTRRAGGFTRRGRTVS